MFDPNIDFANKEFLYALAILPLLIVWYIRRHKRSTSDVRYSTLLPFANLKPTTKERLRHVPFVLRLLVIGLLIVGLARPRTTSSGENVYTEGIDIVLLFDISGSMLARDLQPNRIEAARDVMMKFIDGRKNDRIGLVIFSGESFTQCPMTLDYRVLKNQLAAVKQGIIEDGTAIGMAIAQGVNRLKDSKAKSKVIILLTDGANVQGPSPREAAQKAADMGVRVFTIGVGNPTASSTSQPGGGNPQNGNSFGGGGGRFQVDETTLKAIAETTDGEYFLATNAEALTQIYKKLNTEIVFVAQKTEVTFLLTIVGASLLLGAMALSMLWFNRIP